MDALELKGTVSPLTVLRLKTADVVAIERDLFERVDKVPQMLLNAPVVVDVGELAEAADLSFPNLVAALRRCQVVPVGVANLAAELTERAVGAGLRVMPLRRAKTEPMTEPVAEPVAEPEAEPEPEPVARPSTMVLRNPVRGGQVVYAKETDLLVLSSVNPGAQVIADGHIHVYGPLRGGALAGAAGNQDARIFCQHLAAELVSIAGEYLAADDLPDVLRGKPAQIYLKDGRVRISPL